ncbi:MAG TPA: sigma-70 family RNA polymerase sigma factor, partial [Gemmatimonas sp.]|nr:sigma-70 family RNA polymerase sigma factor [Gemmatimonas sp.]
MSSSDALLLPRIAAGDECAVAECVARYEALVWSLARRWCRDTGEAEDAVQEIFFDLWKTATRFDRARTTEAGWVAMIARRRLIDRARRNARQPALDALPEGFDLADDREQDLDREDRARRARAVLGELSPVQRQVL